MSNEIQTGKIPGSLASSKSQQTEELNTQKSGAKASGAGQLSSSDKVSMTDDAARLQEIEGLLKNSPSVNNALVAEISQLIAEGRLEINLDSIAASLLETEAGITDPGN